MIYAYLSTVALALIVPGSSSLLFTVFIRRRPGAHQDNIEGELCNALQVQSRIGAMTRPSYCVLLLSRLFVDLGAPL